MPRNLKRSLTNPLGFLRAKLRSGEEPPELGEACPQQTRRPARSLDEEEDDPDRYIKGKYGDYIKY